MLPSRSGTTAIVFVRIFGTAALALALALVSTGRLAAETPGTTKRDAPPMDKDVTALVEGNTRFALDLYGTLRAKRAGNLFFSPASLSTALAMAYAGARDDTAAQMAQVLNLPEPPDDPHAAFATLNATWNRPGAGAGYQLSVANRLWGQQGFDFRPEFQALTRDAYGAEPAEVDFAGQAEAVRRRINAWVEDQTQGKITDLIPPGVLDAMTRLVLTNAVYFKGDWTDPFQKSETREAPFHITADHRVPVPMMNRTGRYPVWVGEGLKALALPYGQGGDLSMVVLLPDGIDGLAELEASLSAETLGRWTRGLRRQRVIVGLPRFTMTSEFDLVETLKEMGMSLPFSPGQANFTGMSTEEELAISAVVHKAYVDVNEAGTEAAAATGIGVSATSAIVPSEPIVFRADHPFLFLIRDNRNGGILFLGRLTDPEP